MLGTLCPWCMLVWAVTIPLFFVVTLRNAREGVFGDAAARRRSARCCRWVVPITVFSYLIVALLAQLQLERSRPPLIALRFSATQSDIQHLPTLKPRF